VPGLFIFLPDVVLRKVIFHIPTITTKVLKAQAWFCSFLVGVWALVMLRLCLFFPYLSLMMLIKRMFIKKLCVHCFVIAQNNFIDH